jgi:hypothetical protein
MYFAFDLLHLDGEDLMRLPLLERKARLETLLRDAAPVIRFSGHVVGDGTRVFEEGAKLGVEGMVSKQVDKPYLPGNRGVWVKTKFLNRQEFVIVDWTDAVCSHPVHALDAPMAAGAGGEPRQAKPSRFTVDHLMFMLDRLDQGVEVTVSVQSRRRMIPPRRTSF